MNNQRFEHTMNLHCINPLMLSGRMDIPYVFPDAEAFIPERLVSFHEVKTFRGEKSNVCVHFFIDDYQFERIWNRPDAYLKMLEGFGMVMSPDFSMFMDMPKAVQIWNHYRKMVIGQFLQQHGIAVVPTLNWSDEDSFRFCFDGMPEGGTVAVSSVGCCKDSTVRRHWVRGMNEAVRRLKPGTILFYGAPIEFETGNARIHYFQPEHLERVRERPKNETRTQWLIENPGIVFDVAKKSGIPRDEWEDFQQEVILKSLELRDGYDAAKAKI